MRAPAGTPRTAVRFADGRIAANGSVTWMVDADGVLLRVRHWPGRGHGTPALLSHGTGFTAATWNGVAERLRASRDVFAYDRRGHGTSDKPAGRLSIDDFTADVPALCRSLGLRRCLGVGHSAGATDLLLASLRQPDLFAGLFLHEPTIANAGARAACDPFPASIADRLERVARRRGTFPSKGAALEQYATRPLFAAWRSDLLQAYVETGFEEVNGEARLLCAPEIEWEITENIAHAMDDRDPGNGTFLRLPELAAPYALARSAWSDPIFGTMADRLTAWTTPLWTTRFECGHCAPMERPDLFAGAALKLAADTGA
ncbi:alpha/beta fold hydrolase [Azospirillum sp.]|uniref:alpha/beta fold hydrolase n=1 Tax=Azospirillum sp. TaxID=34012 RepID=UPI003D748339